MVRQQWTSTEVHRSRWRLDRGGEAGLLLALSGGWHTYGEVHLSNPAACSHPLGMTAVCAGAIVVSPTHVYVIYAVLASFQNDFRFIASFSAPGVKPLSSYDGWLNCPPSASYPACD